MDSLTAPTLTPAPPLAQRAAPHGGDEERIYGPFDAWVRVRPARGDRFESAAALDDVSAADFGLCLPGRQTAGARLFAVVTLGRARVALRGVVREAEARADGGCRLRVSITHHRFLR
jgi:hypothetical protein